MDTKFVHREIDEETTKKLLKLFKSKEVSFHAVMHALPSSFNWALMDILIEKGLTEKEIELSSRHTLDVRRYWKKSSTIQLGSHVILVRILINTDRNVGKNFLEYANGFSKDLK